ncbi:2TM domain-containing protein [Fulvivirga imtechensis]|nr:2TM domain-containing protein [Fulvivirga imtechensis]
MKTENQHSTARESLRQLNYFIGHVVAYFMINLALLFFIFTNMESRWWVISPAILWALVLLYHAIKFCGISFRRPKKQGGDTPVLQVTVKH